MVNNSNKLFKQGFGLIPTLLLCFAITIGLVGCGSNNDNNPTPTASTDPKGYYTGAADVKDAGNADLHIDDLQLSDLIT